MMNKEMIEKHCVINSAINKKLTYDGVDANHNRHRRER